MLCRTRAAIWNESRRCQWFRILDSVRGSRKHFRNSQIKTTLVPFPRKAAQVEEIRSSSTSLKVFRELGHFGLGGLQKHFYEPAWFGLRVVCDKTELQWQVKSVTVDTERRRSPKLHRRHFTKPCHLLSAVRQCHQAPESQSYSV